VTAGNSLQTSDGAAFVIVVSESKMKELGVDHPSQPLCTAKNYGGIGPPIEVIPLALKKAGLDFRTNGRIELNEVFASQSLCCGQGINQRQRERER